MTLRRRLTLQIVASIATIALLSVAAIVGVRGVRQDFSIALAANAQLRDVYAVGPRVAIAKAELEREPASVMQALRAMRSAEELLATITSSTVDTKPQMARTSDAIHAAVAALASNSNPDPTLAEPMSALANLSAAVRQSIEHAQLAADRKHDLVTSTVIVIAALSTLVTILIGWQQYRSVMRPLNALQRAARQFAAGRLEERIDTAGDREFSMLAVEFNRMAAELRAVQRDLERRVEEKSRALVRSEQLASVGYLAAGVAHEINNPLGIIAGYGERSLRKLHAQLDSPSEMSEALSRSIQVMCDEAFRCKQITDRLLQLARPGDSTRRRVSLLEAAREAIAPLSAIKQFAARPTTIESDGGDLFVKANEGELRQLLLNLLINAFEACDPNGEVAVSVRRSNDTVELHIIDTGRGMSPETAARVFEPFFTDKLQSEKDPQPRVGTGLGLSIAHAIVADHGGRIEASSPGIGRGSTFSVFLPAAERVKSPEDSLAVRPLIEDPSPNLSPSTERGIRESSSSLRARGEAGERGVFGLRRCSLSSRNAKQETASFVNSAVIAPTSLRTHQSTLRVLIVEDEPRLRELLLEIVPDMGFDVVASRTGEEALRLMESARVSFDILLLDLNLPGIGGMTVFERARLLHANLQVIVLTGFGDLPAAQRAIQLDVVEFLSKPFHLNDVERALGEARRRCRVKFEATNITVEVNQLPPPQTLAESEYLQILAALERNGGSRTLAAEELGISRRTLHYRLAHYRRFGGP